MNSQSPQFSVIPQFASKTSENLSFAGWSPLMYTASYRNGSWVSKGLVKGTRLAIDVSASGVQFGQSVFEGCFAVKRGADILFFRPDQYHQRLSASCKRLCIPIPDKQLFYSALCSVSRPSEQWQLPFESDFVYLRPILLGSNGHIVPIPSDDYEFVILAAPFTRPYNHVGVNLYVEQDYGRTAANGMGAAKTAANYAHIYYPNRLIKGKGFDGILWLDAASHTFLEEANIANIFIETDSGIITPALNGHLLPGITRASVIELLRKEFATNVIEKSIDMNELITLHGNGKIHSVFITGTAVGVQPVASVTYDKKRLSWTVDTPLIMQLRERLIGIQSGNLPDRYGWVTTESDLCDYRQFEGLDV